MKNQTTDFKKWAWLMALVLLPMGATAENGSVDVDKYQSDLSHEIEQLKAQPAAPASTPVVKSGKKKAVEKAPAAEATPASVKKTEKKSKASSDLEELKAQVAQLSQKVGGLEGQGSSFKFGLLLQGRGFINDTPSVKIGGNNVQEGMDEGLTPGTLSDQVFFRRCEMKFYGGFANNQIQYVVMIDPVGVPAATKNLIQDFFLTASPVKYLDLTFGQTKYPQGLEARTSAAKLDFINRSTLGGGNGFGDQRDLLVQVSGTKVPLLQDLTMDYALAAVNGQGRNNAENNNAKDGAARLGLQFKGLWVGASAYDGLEQAAGVTTPLEMWRIGAEAQWVLENAFTAKDNLKFQAEWGQGSLVNENGVTKAAFSAASGGAGACGFYAEALYRVSNTRVGVRYELWDPKDLGFAASGSFQNYITLGLDQYFSDDHLRVSANWIHPNLNNPAGGTLNVGEIAETQVQLTF